MEKQRVKNIFKGIGRGLSIALIALEVVAIICLVVSKAQGNPPTLFGHQMYFIKTGSMSPYLEPGDIIISKKYDGGELTAGEDGDVVTYRGEVKGNAELITHRVMKIDGDTVVTLGDANVDGNGIPSPDAPITRDKIEAVMVYKTVVIDKIFYVVSTTWGFWLFVFTPIALLLVSEIVSLVKEMKKEKEVADENEEGKE